MVVEEKARLRSSIGGLRRSLSREAVEEKSLLIQKLVEGSDFFHRAGSISCYVAKGNEVQTEGLIRRSLELGKRVCVPFVEGMNLGFSELRDFGELAGGTFGILEPRPEYRRVVDGRRVGVVMVPGLVWDDRGQRIGYGRGYYDRYLSTLKPVTAKVGLVFQLQMVERVPTSGNDVRVDFMVTENGIIRCRGK